MVGGTDAVKELREEIAKLSPERASRDPSELLQGCRGPGCFAERANGRLDAELEAELEFVTQAVAMMDRSDMAKCCRGAVW